MGCCISKCKPKTTKTQLNPGVGVQDKLVISESRPSTPPQSPPLKWKTVRSPASLTSVSFACSTQSSSTSCGSSSLSSESSGSSIAFSKVDRTFSNDFLQSCALGNPQIIGLDPIKKIGVVKQLGQARSTCHKRARPGSPTLTRQKSFRIEKERLPYVVNGRISTMRSPSPSRIFNQNNSNCQRQPMMSNRVVKVNSRPASPNRNVISKERPICLRNKERFGYEIGSKVEGAEVAEVLSRMSYSGSAAMEDLDNPHIALDCFIFL